MLCRINKVKPSQVLLPVHVYLKILCNFIHFQKMIFLVLSHTTNIFFIVDKIKENNYQKM